jgi:hypothetical protein
VLCGRGCGKSRKVSHVSELGKQRKFLVCNVIFKEGDDGSMTDVKRYGPRSIK